MTTRKRVYDVLFIIDSIFLLSFIFSDKLLCSNLFSVFNSDLNAYFFLYLFFFCFVLFYYCLSIHSSHHWMAMSLFASIISLGRFGIFMTVPLSKSFGEDIMSRFAA